MMSQPGNPGFFASARIMWQEFGIAFCLVLVLEGILPFLCPRQWREAVTGIGRLSDRHLRLVAACCSAPCFFTGFTDDVPPG